MPEPLRRAQCCLVGAALDNDLFHLNPDGPVLCCENAYGRLRVATKKALCRMGNRA